MKFRRARVTVFVGVILSAAVGLAIAAQDKYAVKVPDGLALSEFRGYESWPYVSTRETPDRIKIIGGNAKMIAAFHEGFPENGKPVPDGAVLTKMQWTRKPSAEFPDNVTVAGELKEVEFMLKDAKRFPNSNGWGYAIFSYDAASKTYAPVGMGSGCGTTCHNAAAKKDYVFTEYSLR